MAGERILVVDDEEDVLTLIEFHLNRNGYRFLGAGEGEEALRKARREKPDLIVLDLMLPKMDGLNVCRILKDEPATRDIPVVMLTARKDELDIVRGFEVGADDYVTKPFSPRVLVARIRSVLRRKPASASLSDSSVVQIHDITIHPGRHEVTIEGQPVALTATEFRIFHLLARKPGWVFTRYQIVSSVHGEGYPFGDRSVDVQIAGLRKKLGPAGRYIQTVRSVGYRFPEEKRDL